MSNLSQQIKTVKSFLDLLNEEFRYEYDGIPSNIRKDQKSQLLNCKVLPAPYFFARFCSVANVWWLDCTNYWVWSSEIAQYYFYTLKQLAFEQGFVIHFGQVDVVRPAIEKQRAKERGEPFLGKIDSTILYE